MSDKDDKQIHLFAATNSVGSQNSCEIGYTVGEWKKMDSDEQDQIIHEYMANIVDIWIETEDGDVVE